MKNKSTAEQSIAVRNCIRYVKQRVKYFRMCVLDCSDNQISYFNSLSESIDNFARNHKLFMKYTLGKITFEEVKLILGEDDRQVFRYLKRQRELLIDYIQEKEIEYLSKYPFNDNAIINMEIDENE